MAGYCVEADVIAYAQTASDYDATTTPTQVQVEAFIDRRAAEIYAWIRAVIGDAAPGPSGYATTIDNSTDAGLALEDLTTQANAIGAAIDALQAAGAGEGPSRSERVAELMALYYGTEGIKGSLRESIEAAAGAYQGESDDSATHISRGETTEVAVVSVEETGLTFDGGTEW